MKRKTIIICVIVMALCIPLFVKIYDTNRRYVLPEEKWLDVGESFEYEGLRYELKDVEVYDTKGLAKRLDMQESSFEQVGALEGEKVKYFLVTLDLTALEEGYLFDLSQLGLYSRYSSAYTAEYDVVLQINDQNVEKGLKVGESAEYYMVFKLSTLYYTEEGLEELDENDIAMAVFDVENGCMNYLCKGGKPDAMAD